MAPLQAVRHAQRRRRRWLAGLVLVLPAACLLALGLGPVALPPAEVAALVAGRFGTGSGGWPATHEAIVWSIRMPRVLLALLAGAALGTAGTAFQGMFRNPMADPYVIGASSGAALGAALVMHLGGGVSGLGQAGVPVFAFAGALLAVGLAYRLASAGGRIPVTTLLLAGIAIAAMLSAAVSFLVLTAEESVRPLLFWLMGSLNGASWRDVAVLLVYLAGGSAALVTASRPLNALLLGEEPARTLGVEAERLKRRVLVAGTLLTAAAVSVSGVIGFVGLIVPHVVRLLAGPDHRFLVPATAAVGGLFLLLADTLARTVFSPLDLPVGILTAVSGGPFFLYLLHRRGRLLHGMF